MADEDLPVINWRWWHEEFGLLWTQAELIERGWTKANIAKRLDPPDALGKNPHGGRARLYRPARVLGAEKRPTRKARILPFKA